MYGKYNVSLILFMVIYDNAISVALSEHGSYDFDLTSCDVIYAVASYYTRSVCQNWRAWYISISANVSSTIYNCIHVHVYKCVIVDCRRFENPCISNKVED